MLQAKRLVVVGILLAGSVAFVGDAAARRPTRLQTHKGTMTLGGTFGFVIDYVEVEGQDGQSGVLFDASPAFGYFVVDNLMLGGALQVQVGFADLYDRADKQVGFAFNLAYLFNFGSVVVPYVGFAVGPLFQIPYDDAQPPDDKTRVLIGLDFPVGLQIALNRHVAIDVGTHVRVAFRVTDPDAVFLTVPIGYLGIAGYF
jgi:hypothetical protein